MTEAMKEPNARSSSLQGPDSEADSRPSRPMIWAPLILVTLLSAIFMLTDLDLRISDRFYSPTEGWPVADSVLARAFDRILVGLGAALATCALITGIAALLIRRLRPHARNAWFLVLCMLLGPGLVVNGLGKGYFGRPRPRHVEEFGGARTFRQLGTPGIPHHGASFPSGDAAVGFFLMTPYFFLLRRRRRLALGFLSAGLASGILTGCLRVMSGAHFASDILASGALVYLVGLGLYYLMRPDLAGAET